ncbi:MAG: ABC transporter permease [Alphaproteobacteria bacterium]|nr:ABC transporter permease [Alphaproteobacteria bacterium]
MMRWAKRAGLALLYLFLLAPLIPIVVVSFSNDAVLAFPPQSFGVRWYAALLGNTKFMAGFRVSATVAAIVVAISLAVGVPAAFALARLRFVGREALYAVFTAPLLLPSIVLGLALLLVLVRLGLTGSYPGLVAAHLVVALPYVIRIVATALGTLPPDVEDAAASLGASPARVFGRVTLPLLLPAVLGAAALAFLVSFDEVVISLFVVGARLTTLPVEIYNYVEYRTDPQIAALSVVLIAITVAGVLLLERTVGFLRAFGR